MEKHLRSAKMKNYEIRKMLSQITESEKLEYIKYLRSSLNSERETAGNRRLASVCRAVADYKA